MQATNPEQMMNAPVPQALKLDDRPRPGKPRLPILDTRHPDIHLSRTRKYTQNRVSVYKAVVVISVQTVWRNGKAETVNSPVGQVSERAYRKRATQTVRRFKQLLDDALAISRYIDREGARGRYPKELVHVYDLPAAEQEAQGNWDHISLSALFDSYRVYDPEFQPATTSGDPVATWLQTEDLRRPTKPVALNGHHLKFKATTIGKDTFYLPTGICRLRHGWRLFVRHQDGVWWDLIEDQPGQMLDSSLRGAWLYFVSQLRTLIPPARRLAPVTLQRCFTGVEGGTFLIHKRAGSWRFQLRYSQKLNGRTRFNTTVGYWHEDTLSEGDLRLALRHLAAMDAYRKHAHRNNSLADIKVTTATPIPQSFWPLAPIIPVSMDDLIYEVELR